MKPRLMILLALALIGLTSGAIIAQSYKQDAPKDPSTRTAEPSPPERGLTD